MNVVVSAIVDPWVTTFYFVVALATRIQGPINIFGLDYKVLSLKTINYVERMNSIITTYNVSTYFKIVIIKDLLYILDIKGKHIQYQFSKGENKMFCTNCGSQNPENQKFCTNCGAKLPEVMQQEQSSQTTTPAANEKDSSTAQVEKNSTATSSTQQQPTERTQNNSVTTQNINNSKNTDSFKTNQVRNKQQIIVVAIAIILALSGIGAATYVTHGFGLLSKQNETAQTTSNTSASTSSDSSKSDTQKTEEKPSVKVSNIVFETTQAAIKTFGTKLLDVYSIKFTVENNSDDYVFADPTFVFNVTYKDKYGDNQSGTATLLSNVSSPDVYSDNGILLAPHEKKTVTYYISDFSYDTNNNNQMIPDARFNITDAALVNAPDNPSIAKGNISVDSVNLKDCPFSGVKNNIKIISADEAKASLSLKFEDFSSKLTGTITNTTKDKWSSASVCYYIEMDGHYVLNSTNASSVSFIKPDSSANVEADNYIGSKQDGHTYEVKPTFVAYQADNSK